jgi:hypothetical protein
MILEGHLLYIDITQICGIGCAFCMYADKHETGSNMELSILARENLGRLINSPSVKRISISGEGEPLNNIKTFHEILSLSQGGKAFEFITSGFFPHDKMAEFYGKTNRIVASQGDTCNIRLSTDSHHIERVKWRAHGFSINYLLTHRPSNLTFSFRSIDTDRSFAREYLISELNDWGMQSTIEPRGALEDALVVGGTTFSIDYKNLVHPLPNTPAGYLDLYGYIEAIENKTKKRFTLGSMNKAPTANGMDVTVKPDGNVYFYGVENRSVGNIHSDELNWEALSNHVTCTPLVKNLYTQPLADVLGQLSDQHLVRSIVEKANNPYWLIKEIGHHKGLLEEIESL